jgi:hypothetical protein
MSAVALDVIFIHTLELTAFFRPIFVYLIPINTRKVALS